MIFAVKFLGLLKQEYQLPQTDPREAIRYVHSVVHKGERSV